MKKILTTCISIAFFIILCLPAFAQKSIPVHKKDYMIQCPANWTIDSSKQMGTDLVFFSMLENATDQFRENVNVLLQDIAGKNIDLAKYTAISIQQIKTMAADAKIEMSKTITAGNKTFQQIIYTTTQGSFKLKFEQYYFIAHQKAYAVTLTTEVIKFDIYKPVGEEILNSFVLK